MSQKSNALEDERRTVEKELQQLNFELERLGSRNNPMALWLQTRLKITENRINTHKVKLGNW